ncbi:NtaA/DmoA family FMN-dependent monooxygenase [Nakamurella sp. YIM 132087]|uniref:NtaA/DmoA family FMN-dependent monooxygenase n=1 Tax=Nakamurella alba TaxID=2665158 RepID=A0A7K1FSD5_9ACTN|nr:NtaA/DmoA family FMN-dependent monooxygenase [Nakamurella alba]MTD17048.1 NtaA/DmoA family FMN-dependent monooxygenase [Nakamurella alba]
MSPLVLGVFQYMLPNGFSGQSWKHPDNRGVDYLTLDHWLGLARKFEDAKLDFLFFADSYGYPTVDGRIPDVAFRDAMNFPNADPMLVITALAAATEKLGFAVTASTVFEEPVANARRFSTLDHFTGGRIGWNIVTGSSQAAAAELFGREMIAHDDRYDRADDYLDLSLKLWESTWEPGAVRADKEAGVYVDPARVHPLVHQGPYHRSTGMHVVEPSPQRSPVLFQAGSSGRGRTYAARNAECVFVQGTTVEAVAATVADIRSQAVGFGRDPDGIKILVGMTVLTAPTHDEAIAKRAEMWAMSSAEGAAAVYAGNTGINLLELDPTRGLSQIEVSGEQGQSNIDRFRGADGRAEPTVGAILDEIRKRGLRGGIMAGAPSEVVDEMQDYVARTGVDGFLLEPHLTPGTYDDFIDLVLPVMRERGLARTEYQGDTLREHLFGAGQRWLGSGHPGAAYRAGMVPQGA